MSGAILDLFAGPGGWDVASTDLGLDPLGIEWDDAACATRKAAGLRTQQADVATLDTTDFSPIWGLIGSPPCQAWSMAGKGGGRRDKDLCVRAALELAAGNDTRAEVREQCEDVRSMLVVEPLRFALDLRPEWIVLEQVPPVLEMWTLFAQILTQKGYNVWAGVLEAERYGVPQTRERAILMASRTEQVHPPVPTHQRYIPGEPRRHDITLDGEVLPWVSMAEALGWEDGPSPSPSPSVTGGGGATGGVEVYASKAARGRVERAVVQTNNFSAVARDPDGQRSKAGSVPYTRPVDDPAPTLDTNAHGWVMAINNDRPERKEQGAGNVPRPVDKPAATVDSTSRQAKWIQDRPAPTVCGDARGLPEPKYRKGNERQWNENAVRVTQQQAATLQTFPPDYPWQGSRSKQFEQIGNAVPPLLAWHVLRAIVPVEQEASLAA